jgi:asparagine synthase (glutamine-hydrolysing)
MPTSDLSIIPTSLIYQAVKGKSKVVLSGEGGDELFGGYLRHRELASAGNISKGVGRMSESLKDLYSDSRPHMRVINPILHRMRKMISLNAGDVIGAYLHLAKTIDMPIDEHKMRSDLFSLYEGHPYKELVPANLFFDMFMYLPHSLLYKNDIASMRSSVEARTPFLDKEVILDASSVADKFRLSPQYVGKAVFKEILADFLPRELIDRPKKGFGFSFDAYDSQRFITDYKKASKFHIDHSAAFGLGEGMQSLLREDNARDICRKFPRFAFSLITNWMIFNR